MPPRVEPVDLGSHSADRESRKLGRRSQFDGARGRPRPGVAREAMKALCILWRDRGPKCPQLLGRLRVVREAMVALAGPKAQGYSPRQA
eukprot:445546-Alexandrium_andersonii.AAC.1